MCKRVNMEFSEWLLSPQQLTSHPIPDARIITEIPENMYWTRFGPTAVQSACSVFLVSLM